MAFSSSRPAFNLPLQLADDAENPEFGRRRVPAGRRRLGFGIGFRVHEPGPVEPLQHLVPGPERRQDRVRHHHRLHDRKVKNERSERSLLRALRDVVVDWLWLARSWV